MAKGKVRRSSRIIKLCSVVDGGECCIFCDRPHSGHIVSEFDGDFSEVFKGLAISVCESCRKHRTRSLATVMQKYFD